VEEPIIATVTGEEPTVETMKRRLAALQREVRHLIRAFVCDLAPDEIILTPEARVLILPSAL
jgi:hypothetical protein